MSQKGLLYLKQQGDPVLQDKSYQYNQIRANIVEMENAKIEAGILGKDMS